MAINTHKDGHLEYITSSDGTKHYLNAEYLDGHSYDDISSSIDAKADNHRHFKSGDSQRNNGVYTYYKLASFPIDNAGNSCSLTVDGRIGGWNNGNKGYLSMIISNRDGISATGTLIGDAQLNDLCDLVVYTSGATSANSTATLYVKTYSWFAFDLTLGAMSGVEDIYDGNGVKTTPAGTLAWALSQNLNKFLQVRDDGDVLKQGHSVALKSEIPSITNKGATLDWGASKTIATIGSTDITAKLPSNPNTDTRVTSAANHYAPTADSSAQLSVDASSATAAAWDKTALVTGVNLQRDSKGHVTGVTVDSVKMPANPNSHQAIKTLKTDNAAAQAASAGEAIAGTGVINLHKISKTGSYSDLNNKPTNLVTTDTEQYITGKKYFENDVNFGKYVSPIRQVSDAPANLHLMNSSQTTAGFFDTVIFAGAGDWLYLGHLKPTFSIKASFHGNGEESDAYSASLGYTRRWLDFLTDWDYQSGWMVRPTKVSTTTPAIIQIKFTNMLYTDVLRLILTGHNLNDSSGNYSGFLDDYTIEVCTDYAKDTWTTVVNRTNANDNIGKGLIYAMQTGSDTKCYGIRLKITKCHVNGQGYAYIKITSMQLRDYRPGIKFPDCLGAVSQNGGDVWGALNTNHNLRTHAIFPEATNYYSLGTPLLQYYDAYAGSFYENGRALSDKYLDKGTSRTSSTVVNQIVYNPIEMKKALTVPSVQGTKYADNSGAQHPLFELGGTADNVSGSSSLTLYRNRAGSWDSATISFTPGEGLKIDNYAVGVQNWGNIPASYILTNSDGVTKDYNGGVKLKSTAIGGNSDDFVIDSFINGKLHSKITLGSTGIVGGGWCIDDSKILTESSLSTQQWTLTSTTGTTTTVNICVK